jgi:uncharacterized membrane protein
LIESEGKDKMKGEEEIEQEIEQRTKLDNKEKAILIFTMSAIISAIAAMIMLKDMTWGIVALLWFSITIEDYVGFKKRKLDGMEKEILWNIIKTQHEIIKKLSERDE